MNLQRSGGLIYSPNTYTLESNMLSSQESKKLNDLISNSNFYNLNESLLSTKGADIYVYKIKIENKGKSQSLVVNITDLSIPKELKDLISFVMDFHNK